MNKRVKVLCLCSMGQNRSVVMTYLGKTYGWDALAAGVDINDPQTIDMLCHWADYIWIAQWDMKSKIENLNHHDKLINLPIGHDIWGYNPHPDMMKKAQNEIFPKLALELRVREDARKAASCIPR